MKLNQREEYQSNLPELNINSTPSSPHKLFDAWYKESEASSVHEANIMVVASVNSLNMPSQRAVLLREIWEEQFVFYTNYQSAKGGDFATNKNVSLFFYWRKQHRQVRINGTIKKIPTKKSQEYFNSRPLKSQVSSGVSMQSKVLENKQFFINKINKGVKQLQEKKQTQYPYPENWGGYGVLANRFEFWQGRPSRIHERLIYKGVSSANTSWKKVNLYP